MKEWAGNVHPDPKMNPQYWHNRDKGQNHYLESYLSEVYPDFKEERCVYVCKPGTINMLPHGYMRVHSRDCTPCNGTFVLGKAVESFPKSMLRHPEKTL